MAESSTRAEAPSEVRPDWATPPRGIDTDLDRIVDIYKAYLEDLGRIGGRHETARAFYLSVISALFVFLGLAGAKGRLVVGVIGVLISSVWFAHMRAFASLFDAKLKVLRAVEGRLPVKPFTEESRGLPRLTYVDKWTAVICAILFGILIFVKLTLGDTALTPP